VERLQVEDLFLQVGSSLFSLLISALCLLVCYFLVIEYLVYCLDLPSTIVLQYRFNMIKGYSEIVGLLYIFIALMKSWNYYDQWSQKYMAACISFTCCSFNM